MRKENTKNTKFPRKPLSKGFALILAVALLLQSMAFGVSAIAAEIPTSLGGGSSSKPSGITKLEVDELTAQLKKDLISSFNSDLVKKVSDYELKGSVGLIITFSDDSLVAAYTRSGYDKVMPYSEFKSTVEAKAYEQEMLAKQEKVLERLVAEGVVNEVKYNYVHVADAAFVKTTYEMINRISQIEGVERIMISNRYLPAAAVENPVDVYGTGIFNSGSVSYTGQGTIVAVLDTGCDYSHSAFTSYVVENPLYDRDDITNLLATQSFRAEEFTSDLEARQVYYGNVTGNKIAFGYDYADKDPDIMPFENSHGTHVAGIIAGKYETITGVAVDAQLAIMKVFSDYDEGAEDGDIIAALEDCVVLGVDAINMSLGSSCGFSYESEPDQVYKNDLYKNIEKAGISLVVAASNDFSSAFGSEEGNTNKTDNPDSATVGAPSTYESSMSVASINGKKDNYMLANGKDEIFFTPSVNTAGKDYDFFAMLGITEGESVSFDYVTVPGVGMKINYAGIDVNGKIALVKRGDITFEEKVQYAAEAGAVAVIIYNNVFGDISMTIGNNAKIPAVSIGKDEGDKLAAQGSGTLEFDLKNLAGPFMSDFSSWGPNPDLTLKPEITAHGGNIYSAIVGGEYDEMSGTSMAAPNMCGITVLIRQYVKENFPKLTVTEQRDLVNQLTMSTATIAHDRKGNPYSPRKQGAGIADIAKSTTTPAYLYVDGIGKTKLELRDDPTRSGVYEMSINLKNISDASTSYRLGSIVMTESVSTSDPEYVAEMAYLLSGATTFEVTGGSYSNGVVTVAAGETAVIKAKITLSAEDKSYLNSTFENGMYVEGFLTFDNTDEKGVDLNAPFLAFYGDWGEAPIFDLDYYEVETEAHNDAIDDDEKIKADYYATTPLGSYYYDYVIPLGTYVYTIDKSKYTAIPATMDKAAVSCYADCISGLYGVFVGLLRGAKELKIEIINTSTGDVIWSDVEYNCYKAHYYGAPSPYAAYMNLPTVNLDTGEMLGNNNVKLEVKMSAKLDWDGGENVSDSYSFSFYIDYEAPTVVSSAFRTEYDKSRKENRYYVDLTVYDNHYAMSVRPIVVYDIIENGQTVKTYSALTDNPIPVYQENRGENTIVSFEITDYLDQISESSNPSGLTLYLDDYAMNAAICYVPFPETDKDLDFAEKSLELDINETFDLSDLLVYAGTETPAVSDYFGNLNWASTDESVVIVKGGKIEALKTGTAKIKVTSDSWFTTYNGINIPTYKEITINVTETVMENDPDSGKNASIEDVKFLSYKTLFAFNTDIDYSEIGITDSVHYLNGNDSIAFYPSEKIQLNPQVDPWNLSDYTLSWSSSNPKVATVDDQGIVTAEAEGKARITLKVTTRDGKTSLLAARLSVEVKSEFIIENRTLVAYKGKGGDVVIPDDEGIIYIGDFAFSHYDLDNEKEVEKDENGYYDMDEKKTAIGNNTLTSVVIPEGVEAVNKYAFYNCSKLTKVTLPTTCKTIGERAFESCDILQNVNFDHVKIVSDYAFYKCESLSCEDIGGAKTEAIYTVGDYGFAYTRFSSLKLDTLSRVGKGAFEGCSKLTTVELGQRTRVSESMFANSGLTSIKIYGDSIDDKAFIGCTKLKSVEIVNDVTYLGASAFSGCKALESVTVQNQLEQIGANAFEGCSKLKSFKLPDGKIKIGDKAFASTGLTKLEFAPNTEIAYLGASVFNKVSTLSVDVTKSTLYVVEGNAVYNTDKDVLVLAIPSSTGTFTVPAGVKTIGSGAFSSLSSLTKVTFASGSRLETIGDNAFAGCAKLNTVVLPEIAIEIGNGAFSDSGLSSINLSKVTAIGDYAFSGNRYLSSVNLGDVKTIGTGAFYLASLSGGVVIGEGAVIGDYAFYGSSVRSVMLDGDAEIGYAAFYGCSNLLEFDFSDVTGKIPDHAFHGCSLLSSVYAPKITEIGESAFSDCFNLSSFDAAALKVVGNSAFAPIDENANYANRLETLNLPSLEKVGENAFLGMLYLKSVDLSKVSELGAYAFSICESLETVTLGDALTEIPMYGFYGCVSLKNIDLSKIVTFGEGAFYCALLPEKLSLDSAEYIGMGAFVEQEGVNDLVEVYAPKLKHVGSQAFATCIKLKTFDAPVLETIEYGAFSYTAIEKFAVGESLTKVEMNAFEGCTSFKTFYAMVDGQEVDTAEFENVKIHEGVLYVDSPIGYVLVAYPAAKDSAEYTVLEGTVRIEFGAAYLNEYIEKLVLPSTLKYIGNYAFEGCKKLSTVVFKSYYAPILESTLTGTQIEITRENASDYDPDDFKLLYGTDYYYLKDNTVSPPYYYNIFKGLVGHKDSTGLTAILPESCEGYDSLIYVAYFDVAEETSGLTAGKYAEAFMTAVSNLPAEIDRFSKALIDAAIGAYNALQVHSTELEFVDESYFTTFENARRIYNVDVVENKIAHLFDMDMLEYCFNDVKDAKWSYDALTAEEKALVTNASVLDEKIAKLNELYGKVVNFGLSYADNLPIKEDDPIDPPVDIVDDDKLDPIVIVLIAVGSALVLAGAAVAVVFVLKKKKATVTGDACEEDDYTSEEN